MQLIIISSKNTKHQHWHISSLTMAILALLVMMMMTATIHTAYQVTTGEVDILFSPPTNNQSKDGLDVVQDQQEQIHSYYTRQLGSLQAEAIRLKTLTNKLAEMSGLDIITEGLTQLPSQGGIADQGDIVKLTEFDNYLEQLQTDFQHQNTGLSQIQDYLISEENIKSAIPHGSPVKKGWVSSYYGYRIDPFSGKKTFHNGIDIAGKAGSKVRSVADGIVTWQGSRGGYGEMIEIDHGNGYQTRYAHNQKLIVALGERIEKGQAIALMGSTGRSTGPHVHFEVLRDGKTINPANFLK